MMGDIDLPGHFSMNPIVAIHSFRHGVGTSSLIAYLAMILARQGQRVGAIEIQTPSAYSSQNLEELALHTYLQVTLPIERPSLQDYLADRVPCSAISYPVHPSGTKGSREEQIYFIPFELEDNFTTETAWSLDSCSTVLAKLTQDLGIQYLLLDVPAGITPSSLMMLGVADYLIINLCPDKVDFQGTAVIADVAKRLNIPQLGLILNQVPDIFDLPLLQGQIQELYNISILGYLPFAGEIRISSPSVVLNTLAKTHAFRRELDMIALRIQTFDGSRSLPFPSFIAPTSVTLLDILMLPDAERQLMNWLIHQGAIAPTKVANYLSTSLSLSLSILEKLVRQGVVVRVVHHGETLYQSVIEKP